MRVTGVETFLIHPGRGKNLLFVKVSTDEGIHGWGECYTQSDRDQSVEWTVHQMARYLKGRDPFAIKHFTYVMYTDFLGKRGSTETYCAISGIEHALWDIAGKAAGSRSTTCSAASAATRSGSTPTAGPRGSRSRTRWLPGPSKCWRWASRR